MREENLYLSSSDILTKRKTLASNVQPYIYMTKTAQNSENGKEL